MEYTVKDVRNVMNKCNKQLGKICSIEDKPEVLKSEKFDLQGFLGETAQCLARSTHLLSLVIDNTKVDFNMGGNKCE